MIFSWDDDIPNIWENKKCSKPPTSYVVCEFYIVFITLNVRQIVICGVGEFYHHVGFGNVDSEVRPQMEKYQDDDPIDTCQTRI